MPRGGHFAAAEEPELLAARHRRVLRGAARQHLRRARGRRGCTAGSTRRRSSSPSARCAYADGDAQVTVMRERSLSSRFARSAPTQATGVDDIDRRASSACATATRASATTNHLDEDAPARRAAREATPPPRAAARGGRGELPGPARRRPDAARTTAATRRPPSSTRRAAGAALRDGLRGCAERGLEAFGIWTAGAVRDRDRVERRGPRRPTR